MRLNVWHRAGVVASALWMIGAVIWVRVTIVKQAVDASMGILRTCETVSEDGCHKAVDAARDAVLDGWEIVALVAAIAPVIVGWVLAYVVIWTVRWVLAGRGTGRESS